jgi:hypothetical protein
MTAGLQILVPRIAALHNHRGYSKGYDSIWDVLDHHSTGSNHGVGSDPDTLDYRGTKRNSGKISDDDVSPDRRAWRQTRESAHATVVVQRRLRVYDAELPYF